MTKDTWDQSSLEALGRRDLQRVAKQVGVRANNKSADIVASILAKLSSGVQQHHTNPLGVFDYEAEARLYKSRSPSQSPGFSERKAQGIIETSGCYPMKSMDAGSPSTKPIPFPKLPPIRPDPRCVQHGPCDSNCNPMQSVTLPGVHDQPAAKAELESDAETPVKTQGAPSELVAHPVVPSPSPMPKPASRLDKLKLRLGVKTPEDTAGDIEGDDAAAHGRATLLRRSLLDRAVSWASPKGRRARTSEWVQGATQGLDGDGDGTAVSPLRRATTDVATIVSAPEDGGLTPEPAHARPRTDGRIASGASGREGDCAATKPAADGERTDSVPGKEVLEGAEGRTPARQRAGRTSGAQQQLQAQMDELSMMQAELRRSMDDGVGRAILRRARLGLALGEDAPRPDEKVQAGPNLSRTLGRTTSAPGTAPKPSFLSRDETPKKAGKAAKPSSGGSTVKAKGTPSKRVAAGSKAATPGHAGGTTPSFARTLKRPGHKAASGTPRPPARRRQAPPGSPAAAAAATPRMLTKGSGTGGGAKRALSTPQQRPPTGAPGLARMARHAPPSARKPPVAASATPAARGQSRIPKASTPFAKAPPSKASTRADPGCPRATASGTPRTARGGTPRPPPSSARGPPRGPSSAGSARLPLASPAKKALRVAPCTSSRSTPVSARPKPSSIGKPSPKSKARPPSEQQRIPEKPKGNVAEETDEGLAAAALRIPGVSWQDVPELEAARKSLQPAVDALGKGLSEGPPAAALLLVHEGPERLAEALATELSAPLLAVGPELLGKAQAKGRERQLQDGVFTNAAKLPLAVVLLNYLDQQPQGKAGRDARAQLLADLCLYLEMCATQPQQSTIVLIASSRPETLSADLLGHLPTRVHVGLPVADVREQVIMMELMRRSDEVALDADDVDTLTRLCVGFSAMDISGACASVLSSPGRAERGGAPARLSHLEAEIRRREPSVAPAKAKRLESWAQSHL